MEYDGGPNDCQDEKRCPDNNSLPPLEDKSLLVEEREQALDDKVSDHYVQFGEGPQVAV